jgi:nucleoside triphosphate diphosphatase
MDFMRRLERLMGRLRSKKGCPWDRRQTHRSLKPYLLEETHEVLDAIDSGNPAHLREELGDLLLQVVFHSQMAKEKGRFDLQDVARTIGDKLVRRHPHVFGKSSRRIADINRKWEELKRLEKPERRSTLDGLPRSLPSLLRAQRMMEKTGRDAPKGGGSRGVPSAEKAWKIFRASLRKGRPMRERAAGEFLLAFVRLCRVSGLHAEMALQKAASRFERDFRRSEKKSGRGR